MSMIKRHQSHNISIEVPSPAKQVRFYPGYVTCISGGSDSTIKISI